MIKKFFTKSRVIIGLAVLLTALASFAATYAILIAEDAALNQFVMGESEVIIEETFEPPPELKPGVTFIKQPSVKNTGNTAVYVRMMAVFSDLAAKDFCEPLDIDTENWEYRAEDGYYYYKHPIDPDDSTTSLFTTVKVRDNATMSQMKEFDIIVYTECRRTPDSASGIPAGEYLTVWGITP